MGEATLPELATRILSRAAWISAAFPCLLAYTGSAAFPVLMEVVVGVEYPPPNAAYGSNPVILVPVIDIVFVVGLILTPAPLELCSSA
jgi:hypothetical protein